MPAGAGTAPPRCHPPPDGRTLRHANNSLPGLLSEGSVHGNGSRQPNRRSALAEPFVTVLAHGNGIIYTTLEFDYTPWSNYSLPSPQNDGLLLASPPPPPRRTETTKQSFIPHFILSENPLPTGAAVPTLKMRFPWMPSGSWLMPMAPRFCRMARYSGPMVRRSTELSSGEAITTHSAIWALLCS